ncbi:organic solvent ABC transporter [Cycloclasticus sp. 46_83_sub15_T18]|nr:organic solvent ABC transporter [Cycloclasticus sp. 46_83_sub15_T18]
MKILKGFFASLLLSLLITAASSVSATELSPPQQVIQDTSDLLYSIIKSDKDKLNDREYVFQLVHDVVEPRVDLNKISKLVLGKYWRKASKQQRIEFQKEFKHLLINTYATAFNEFDDWTVKFLPTSLTKNKKRVVVKTEMILTSRPPIAVNYRMARNKAGEWKAYDVIIEGISMVTNYKGSFAKSIKKKGGLDNVIQKLTDKNKRSREEAEANKLRIDSANKHP